MILNLVLRFISEVYSSLVAREEELRFQILLLLSAEVTIKINAGYSGHPISEKQVAQLCLAVSYSVDS